ncbi:hypothetical protein KEJ36_00085 [Candidatus Bathyarchaeota archaeon]|nr:hypothetical protein [Candidatus Bathyarchaeota archaeon]MBS7627223.1 hypothetical protein [Candidatus Bathyarchaeota archaeon]
MNETMADAITIALAHNAHKPAALKVIEKRSPSLCREAFGASLEES